LPEHRPIKSLLLLYSIAAFVRLLGTGLVRENTPHLSRTRREEMRPVLPVNQVQIGETQIKLIDQRRGL